MTDREKLIDLLENALRKANEKCAFRSCGNCDIGERSYYRCVAVLAVDKLIANGVSLETKQATSDKTSDENKRFATDNSVGDKWSPTEPLTNCQRWIPVTERLPESGNCVIVACENGDVAEGCYQNQCHQKWVQFRWSTERIDVTHWMPLPPAPEEV